MRIATPGGCSSSNTHVCSLRSTVLLVLFCHGHISPFLPSRKVQSSFSLPPGQPSRGAPSSCPSAFVSLPPYLSPYATALDSEFLLFPRRAASAQSPSDAGGSAALHRMAPVDALGASAAGGGNVSVVHRGASGSDARICTDLDADGVPAYGPGSRSFHSLREMCRKSPPRYPHSVEDLFHEKLRVFPAEKALTDSKGALSTLPPPTNFTDLRNPSSDYSSSHSRCVLPFSLSLAGTAASPAFLPGPFPSVWSALHCFSRVISLAVPSSVILFSLLSASLHPPPFSTATGCRLVFPRFFACLHTSLLLTAATRDPHHSQHFNACHAVVRSPPCAASAGPSSWSNQTLTIGLASASPFMLAQLPADTLHAPVRAGGWSLLHPPSSPFLRSRTSSAAAAVTASASSVSGDAWLLQLLSSVVASLSSGFPSLLCAAAQPPRQRVHAPPLRHGANHQRSNVSVLEEMSSDASGTEIVGEDHRSATGGDNPTVMRTAPTIRPRRRVPGRRSSSDWQQLFGDLRLVDLSLPATLHSALTDINSVKYFELAVAQKVPVSNQLLDGIRMFDVRAWKDEQDGQWYSEVPWRLEDDFRLLREYAPTAEEASTNSFVSTVLRSLPLSLRPGGKDRGRKGQLGAEKRSGVRKVPSKVLSLVDLHSWTTLEDGLFKPIQEFLRTHISEIAVVVISSFNGNRKTAMNVVPQTASLSSSLQRLAARQQQRQQEGTATVSSSIRLEGHPFYEDFLVRGTTNANGSSAANDRATKQQQARNAGSALGAAPGTAAGAAGGYAGANTPVLSPASTYASSAYLDSLGASPPTYEVLDPLDTTCSFYMSSAIRKPLTYADVASFMALVDKYWGQLLPRHSHVFFGPADDSAYTPPVNVQAARAQPTAASGGPGSAAAGGPAAAATSQAQRASAADAGPSAPPNSPAGSAPPTTAAQQQPTSPPVLRSLADARRDSTTAAKKPKSMPAPPAATPTSGVRGSVGGAAARSASAVDTAAPEASTRTGGTRVAKPPAAGAATPAATRVGGAPGRAGTTTDPRAAPSGRATPAAAAAPTSSTPDTRVAGGRPGAAAALFSAGFDTPLGLNISAGEKGTPRIRRAGAADTASTLLESGSDMPPYTRGMGADYSSVDAAANVSSQIESYPMYESLHRPEAFAEWLRAQGDLLLTKATLRNLLDAKIRLLLFVDDPLIAWYLTAFSREHVIVFVAADHTYDVLYKSEALFGPCALPNRASSAPNSMLLNVSREATWAGCRERCEATPAPPTRPGEGRLLAKLRAARGRLMGQRKDNTTRSCSYWTFEPPASPGNLPPVVNSGEEVYPVVSPAELGLLPFTLLNGSSRGGKASKGGGQQQNGSKSTAAAATLASATAPELKGECRIYAGPLTLADTIPLHGSIIQPRSCGLRTLYELPTQWASAAVFADLTDAVCPIFEVAPSRKAEAEDGGAGANGRARADTLGEAAAGPGKDERQQKEPRSYQFFPELCMLDATPRHLRDAFPDQEEDDSGQSGESQRTNLQRRKGAGLERKLLRVYFSPPSPVPFVDGTRGGRREVGPVDAVSLMNELTATWALWQLERQQLVSSLMVLDTVDNTGHKEETYPYDQLWEETPGSVQVADSSRDGRKSGSTSTSLLGDAGDSPSNAGYLGGSEPHMLVGRERPRSTRPVNALMVMRYDQTKSMIKNFSHLNYFEIIMNLNPPPKETRNVFFQSGEGAELSADRYVKVTAILNSLGMDEELGELNDLDVDGFGTDDSTEEEKHAQTLMMWLAICAAVVCSLIVAVGSTMRSAFFSKRVARGGWTAAETPRRVSVAMEHSPHERRLENLS